MTKHTAYVKGTVDLCGTRLCTYLERKYVNWQIRPPALAVCVEGEALK